MFQCEPRGDIALMRFDRPEKKNALTPKMLASLVSAIDTAASARAIVLSGTGGVFCSGFDLTACRDDPDSTVLADLLRGLSRAVRALRGAVCPVVVSAHGAAIAGGCALLGGADFVVADAAAKIGYPVVKLGISPAISAPFLRQLIGDGAARTRMLDSSLISGTRAMELGLVHECVADVSQCEGRALELAAELALKPRHAIAFTKRWLNQIDGSEDGPMLDAALAASMGLAAGAEERDRLAAVWDRGSGG